MKFLYTDQLKRNVLAQIDELQRLSKNISEIRHAQAGCLAVIKDAIEAHYFKNACLSMSHGHAVRLELPTLYAVDENELRLLFEFSDDGFLYIKEEGASNETDHKE